MKQTPNNSQERSQTNKKNLEPRSSKELIEESSLYKNFLKERDEILKHKWIESEKIGHDIGFEKALLNWVVSHRSAWKSEQKKQNPEGIQTLQ